MRRKIPLLMRADGQGPLYRQFYESIRRGILKSQFIPGYRLPATRVMAREFGVSRNTVANAYSQLIAEGYLEARPGSGTFVSQKLPEDFILTATTRRPARDRGNAHQSPGKRLSERGRAVSEIRLSWNGKQAPVRPFAPCIPSVADFPFQLWAKLAARRLRKPARSLWNYCHAAGYGPLRQAIAAYIGEFRGVHCEPDQVIVVSGTQQALDLAARILLDPGDCAWVEDPGYLGTRGALLAAQVKIKGIPVDEEGLNVKAGIKKAPEARLVCVTPSHQYPLGMTMSVARRLELLAWAQESGAWILEDDYDSEFRYQTRPFPALYGLDRNGCVIYTGTFSKVLNPALRLAYLVVPRDLVEAFSVAKASLDRHSAMLEQIILADFIAENHLHRHIRRMRKLYSARRDALTRALESTLHNRIKILPSSAGLHLTILLNSPASNDLSIAHKALDLGIETEPLSSFYLQHRRARQGLVLGYAPFREKEIHDGIIRLARIVSGAAF